MAYDVTADLAFMFAELPGSVTVTLGTASTSGVLDHVDVIESDGDVDVQVRRPTLMLARGSLTGLVQGSTVTVDGTDYTVREIAREDDGAVLRCLLVEHD